MVTCVWGLVPPQGSQAFLSSRLFLLSDAAQAPGQLLQEAFWSPALPTPPGSRSLLVEGPP